MALGDFVLENFLLCPAHQSDQAVEALNSPGAPPSSLLSWRGEAPRLFAGGREPAGGSSLFRRGRRHAQVVMLHLTRLGRRHMGEFGEAVEHPGDSEIAHRHHGRLPDAKILGVDQPEESEN
jgi:hypothetical protein